MTKEIKKIAELLPEGLSESTINAVAELVHSTINNRVNEEIKVLSAKVISFIRTNMDLLKEQAMEELELENDTFRNAQLFGAIKELISVELTEEDNDKALTTLVKEQNQLEKELSVLTSELNSVLNENQKLNNAVRALNKKVENMEGEKEVLAEERNSLIEEINSKKNAPFNPSETEEAIIINKSIEQDKTEGVKIRNGRLISEFLTEGDIKKMRELI
jgi:septal ring factor EnvC (AmiA/AmiB activator)